MLGVGDEELARGAFRVAEDEDVEGVCHAEGRGRAWVAHGLDGNANMTANLSSQPAEICEVEHPLEILSF